MRIGFGYDIHRLGAPRPLLLGGIEIPGAEGAVAHSDGDVLIHAVIDALLGAAGLGDIGTIYPPEDPSLRGVDSRLLLRQTRERIFQSGRFRVCNLDCVVILEAPRLSPHRDAIRRNLAADLGLAEEDVAVKAKTKEKTGEVGRGEAVEAYAAVLLERRPDDQD
jgi:2-C-methyl-D-erythritol 2,4-cyclodiphosphate synthase